MEPESCAGRAQDGWSSVDRARSLLDSGHSGCRQLARSIKAKKSPAGRGRPGHAEADSGSSRRRRARSHGPRVQRWRPGCDLPGSIHQCGIRSRTNGTRSRQGPSRGAAASSPLDELLASYRHRAQPLLAPANGASRAGRGVRAPGRGHRVRVVGDLAGTVPQSSLSAAWEGDPAPLEGRPGVRAGRHRGLRRKVSCGAPRGPRGAPRGHRWSSSAFPSQGKPIERLLRGFGRRAWGSLVQRAAARVVALDPWPPRSRSEGDSSPGASWNSRPVWLSYPSGARQRAPRAHRLPEHVLLAMGRMEPGRGIEVLVERLGPSGSAATGPSHSPVRAPCGR